MSKPCGTDFNRGKRGRRGSDKVPPAVLCDGRCGNGGLSGVTAIRKANVLNGSAGGSYGATIMLEKVRRVPLAGDTREILKQKFNAKKFGGILQCA